MQNVHKIKQDICEMGRRLYNKGFAAANDGNITVRIGENEFLCTPTMHSKGFLKPDDICTIDFTGKVSALKAIQGGSAGVEFAYNSSNNSSLKFLGKQGVIGLRLFKIGLFDRVKLLSGDDSGFTIDDSMDKLDNDL